MEEFDILNSLQTKQIPILGEGFVKIVDSVPRIVPKGRTMEFRCVQSARVSYSNFIDSPTNGLKSLKEDANLLRYLIRHQHTSPLESVSFQFVVKIPIHVKNQLIRHRTFRVNEYSQRYNSVQLGFDRGTPRMQGNTHNKQSSESGEVPEEINSLWNEYLAHTERTFEIYNKLIEAGVARETARFHLPLSTYTVMYVQMDLNNLMKFLHLRLKPGAQEEIRILAQAIKDLITPLVPDAMSAFDNSFNGIFLTQNDLEVLDIPFNEARPYPGTQGELRELKEKLKKN